MSSIPAKSSKWSKLVSTNPARVVAALSISPTETKSNTYGDSGEEFIFAMDAVRKVVEAMSRPIVSGSSNETEQERRREWDGLVNAGATEALCRNVCELKADNMAQNAMSSFYPPFVMLYFAALGFSDGPDGEGVLSDTDKRVLNVVRDNWREMINRWWTDPQNTLQPDSSHEPERLVVSRLLGNLLMRDSAVYSIIFDPSDHTLSLLTLHWVHAHSPAIARSNMVLLRSLISFTFSQNVTEYLKDNAKPSLPFFMSKIYAGLSSNPQSQSQPNPTLLLETMSTRLTLGPPGDPAHASYAVEDLAFCHDLFIGYRELNESDASSFGDALRSAEAYWGNAFKLTHSASSASSPTPQPQDQPQKEVAVAILNLAVKLVLQRPEAEVAAITRVWLRTGFFDTLDSMMGELVKIPGVSRLLVFLFTSLKESAQAGVESGDFPPDLMDALRDEFPRQKMAAAVIKVDMETQQQDGKSPSTRSFGGSGDDEVPDASDPLWNNGLWQAVAWLHGLCRDPKVCCTRRGCANRVRKEGEDGGVSLRKCSSCKEFGYCGAECQKLDWKEHKHLCKYASPYITAVNAGKNRLTKSKAVEMGLVQPDEDDPSGSGNTTTMDRLNTLSTYITPLFFVMFVIAGQYLGVFDGLESWLYRVIS
ncbi:hypothetical protein BDP27DRAFT_1315301 [Rhodocollybia butyracea]|uniref:MYND-type domain-containing protein n=1 Tax=Rhodocollybia butyracea TaxID=206335 RepID=A0A9P5PZY7_9AGAR|nr:hypothetical protein BDP27DRAFT_1315301 [Rhodocollybia butyracea]